jgi:hypothetical protein
MKRSKALAQPLRAWWHIVDRPGVLHEGATFIPLDAHAFTYYLVLEISTRTLQKPSIRFWEGRRKKTLLRASPAVRGPGKNPVQTRLVSKVNVLSLLAWFLEASCVLQFVLTNSHDSKVSSTESSGNLRKTYSNRGDQIHDLPKPPEVQATPHFGATRNDHVNCNSCRHPTCQPPTSPHSSWH